VAALYDRVARWQARLRGIRRRARSYDRDVRGNTVERRREIVGVEGDIGVLRPRGVTP